jgi:hypothetical protein
MRNSIIINPALRAPHTEPVLAISPAKQIEARRRVGPRTPKASISPVMVAWLNRKELDTRIPRRVKIFLDKM